MPQPIRPLALTPEQRRALEAVAGRPTASRRGCQRARAVLCRADGLSQSRAAAEAGLTQDVIRDGSFASVGDLVAAINAYLEEHNLNPKPYVWRKSGQEILAKIQRAREAHEKAQRMVNEI